MKTAIGEPQTDRQHGRLLVVLATVAAMVAVLSPAAPGQAVQPPAALAWGPCPPTSDEGRDPRQECARLDVPLDYRAPQGRPITITVSRIRTAKPGLRRGILLSNPGGPGGPGVDLPSYLVRELPAEVLDRYDLVGFDPRGIGVSTPITCGLTADVPVDLLLPYPAPDGSITRNIEFARDAARSCAVHGGPVLPFVTTANTARDMDRIRAALGERMLSYLGYSYGTYLGAVYTSMFPLRSDRILLDSAIDPNRIWYGIARTLGPAVALRLPDFTQWAAARHETYQLGATPAAVEQTFYQLAADLDRDPVELSDLLVDGNVFRDFTHSLLYDDREFPQLAETWQYVAELREHPPETLLAARWSRGDAVSAPDDNEVAALWAITCNDVTWPRNPSTYQHNVAVDRRVWPATAGMPSNVWPCAFWPHLPAEPPVDVTANGPRNVLILQNLRDPATAWISGYGLRTALGRRAAMVSIDAGGHGVYAIRSGPCADAIATGFLTTGVLPARDTFCAGPSPDEVTTSSVAPATRAPAGLFQITFHAAPRDVSAAVEY